MHLYFATPWGTSWIPLCYVFYMLETNNWLSMHYYSWSFVCVIFHVITWLLSSIVKIISFMSMFRVLWSQHLMLYIVLIKIVLVHVTSKIIVLLSLTYSRTSRIKLGDAWYVSNVSIIFYAPCLFIHHLLCVLFTLRGVFMHFPELTYYRDATVPVPCFLLFCVSEKLQRKYSWNRTKQRLKSLIIWHEDGVQRRAGDRPGASHTWWWRGSPLGRATRGCDRLVHLLTSPFRLFNPLDGKTIRARTLFQKTYCKPPPSSMRGWEGP
jgi:hypothetical protein